MALQFSYATDKKHPSGPTQPESLPGRRESGRKSEMRQRLSLMANRLESKAYFLGNLRANQPKIFRQFFWRPKTRREKENPKSSNNCKEIRPKIPLIQVKDV